MGSYSNRGTLPPAAVVALRKRLQDPRAAPEYKERVPYLVVYGPPQARLSEIVMGPDEFILRRQQIHRSGGEGGEGGGNGSTHSTEASAGRRPIAHINGRYYVKRIVLPALARVLNLVGGATDVVRWDSLLRVTMPAPSASVAIAQSRMSAHGRRKRGSGTLEFYMLSFKCQICNAPTLHSRLFCERCLAGRQLLGAQVLQNLNDTQGVCHRCTQYCLHHCHEVRLVDGSASSCSSLDCDVYYLRCRADMQRNDAEALCDHLQQLMD